MDSQIISSFLTNIVTPLLSIIVALASFIYANDRKEIKKNTDEVNRKAYMTDLKEVEKDLRADLQKYKDENERLVEKLEARHEKELTALESRLTQQLQELKQTLSSQMEMILDLLRKE